MEKKVNFKEDLKLLTHVQFSNLIIVNVDKQTEKKCLDFRCKECRKLFFTKIEEDSLIFVEDCAVFYKELINNFKKHIEEFHIRKTKRWWEKYDKTNKTYPL